MPSVDQSAGSARLASRAPNTKLLGRILITYAAVGAGVYVVCAGLWAAEAWTRWAWTRWAVLTRALAFVAALISGVDIVTVAAAPWLGLSLFAVQQLLLLRGGVALIRRRGRVMLYLFPYIILRVLLLGFTWVGAAVAAAVTLSPQPMVVGIFADLLLLPGAILASFAVPTFLLIWLTRPAIARDMKSW